MSKLTGSQRKFLRGKAHALKPVVMIGQKGFSETVAQAVEQALDDHELIKIKFNDFKEKSQKQEIVASIEKAAGCESVGMIGHIAICFRQHKDPKKQKYTIPAGKD